ncbi:hypothetical protein B5M43_008215 [Microbacterium sp. MEC084]|uniref:hypothetical protein n=1 Tax=unclassified Microbacterium TaxID=2609290 RepID=UPI0006FEBB47|nr:MULTISPECIES: hypothetical protein [unclassified Microbacterium]KQY96289.1 hypothetical protein ASD19_10185 [Microbacterium sp. Root53]MCD1268825.1 hypothetical protein [Microbacterium sp. MEC084]
MTTPDMTPVRRYAGAAATWAFALVAAILVSVLVPLDARLPWVAITGGVCMIVAFAAQLIDGRSEGFIFRVGVSVIGALGILGFLALIFTLVALGSSL